MQTTLYDALSQTKALTREGRVTTITPTLWLFGTCDELPADSNAPCLEGDYEKD
jgi:hypothetical protein